MKITLFTSNNIRHNYLIKLLSSISDELFVVQERCAIFQGVIPNHYKASPIMKKYFSSVNNAQFKLFANPSLDNLNNNVKFLPLNFGELNKHPIESFSEFLQSDFYVVYGSSYIKGKLVDFLIKQKAINIHAGVSPYYRGTDCNFWALYDGNPHLVGTTIHLLSKGLDNGPMLYHAMSNIKTNPFEYTMSTTKSAFHSLATRIRNNSIFNIEAIGQDKSMELRYSKKNEFSEEIVKKFYDKECDLNRKFDNSLLKEPFFLEN